MKRHNVTEEEMERIYEDNDDDMSEVAVCDALTLAGEALVKSMWDEYRAAENDGTLYGWERLMYRAGATCDAFAITVREAGTGLECTSQFMALIRHLHNFIIEAKKRMGEFNE